MIKEGGAIDGGVGEDLCNGLEGGKGGAIWVGGEEEDKDELVGAALGQGEGGGDELGLGGEDRVVVE